MIQTNTTTTAIPAIVMTNTAALSSSITKLVGRHAWMGAMDAAFDPAPSTAGAVMHSTQVVGRHGWMAAIDTALDKAVVDASALSAAPTPAGSAYASPAVSVKGLAPKKLLVRQPLKASFKIKSRTIFPSTEQPIKVANAQMIRGKEEDQLPIVRGTDAHEDALITNNLPANPYRKKDQYDNPYYRAWAPVTEWGGGCPLEHRMMVLVHFAPMGLETEEDKPKDTYVNFEAYKRHCMEKGIKEWPIAVQYGADLMFFEDEQLRANRIAKELTGTVPTSRPIQKKGRFCCVWRNTMADVGGYNKFIAGIDANLKKRSWTDADL